MHCSHNRRAIVQQWSCFAAVIYPQPCAHSLSHSFGSMLRLTEDFAENHMKPINQSPLEATSMIFILRSSFTPKYWVLRLCFAIQCVMLRNFLTSRIRGYKPHPLCLLVKTKKEAMCSVIVHIDFQDLAVNISHQNGQKSWPWGEKNQNWSAAHRHLSSTPYELCCGTQTLKSFRIDLGVTASVATHTQNKYGRGLASGERAPRLWHMIIWAVATNKLITIQASSAMLTLLLLLAKICG